MKNLILAVFMLVLSSATYADAALLAKDNLCLACHAIDKKVVGPAFKDVAAKYADRSDALDYLTKKIKSGGSGVWGAIPMPAQTQLLEHEVKELAEWVLKAK